MQTGFLIIKMSENVVRIGPFHYIQVLDTNSNITRVEVGPLTFVRQEHEKVVVAPVKMIHLPPMHYCIIKNPVCTHPKTK